MDRTLLLGTAAVLTVALVTGVLTLLKSGQQRRMKERVTSAGALEAPGLDASGLPSIRLQTTESRPLLERFLRFLSYHPDVPQAHTIPWYVVLVLGVLIGVLVGNFMSGPLGLAKSIPLGILSGVFMIRAIFAFQYNSYVDRIFTQIPDAIGLMVRAIRAGLPVGEAMRSVAAELASPLRDEFSRMLGDVAVGRPVDQALMRLYKRTELPEFSFLAVTLGMQSQTGGNLAETLDNLADIVRKRVALSKRAKALAAEARMQAGILMALPFIAALAMSQIQPFYIEQFSTPAGQRLALFGVGFSLTGFLIIRWLIKRAGQD
jgi:tight adherence protein B